MIYFFKRGLFFSIPIILILSLNAIIDPFNLLRIEKNKKISQIKSNISYKVNYPLYKLNQYTNKPKDIIILGDSRADKLKPDFFKEYKKLEVSNLAYGGGTLPEAIKTFWYITEIHTIKEVYFGINFNLYNKVNNMNRVDEAINIRNNKLNYLINHYCLKASFYIIKSLILNKKTNIEKPKQDKAHFWKHQLDVSAHNYYKDYIYPQEYLNQLLEISMFCKENNIKLTFFIPPTHTDLQKRVDKYNLTHFQEKFKKDLKRINNAPFFDFDYANKMTNDSVLFSDPFHFNDSIAKIIVKEIVTNKKVLSK